MRKKLFIFVLILSLLPAAAFADTSSRGDSGSRVKDIQQMLIDLGYLFESADGSFGRKTEEAVKWYQRENGLEETGTVTDELFAALSEARDGVTGRTAETVFCAAWTGEDGARSYNLCSAHSRLAAQAHALIESDDGFDRERGLSLWRDEIGRLYAILLDMYGGEAASELAAAQSTFFLYADRQAAAYGALFADRPEEMYRAMEMLYADKAIELCAMTSTAEG